jgi:hypothetical protein
LEGKNSNEWYGDKRTRKYNGIEEDGLTAKCRARGITVSSVKDPICASRQGLGGSIGGWKSKRDQGEGKPGYRESIPNVI